jgi:hypothetical protein
VSGGHDKYSTFFYRPHFIIAMVIGSGESQEKREEQGPGSKRCKEREAGKVRRRGGDKDWKGEGGREGEREGE